MGAGAVLCNNDRTGGNGGAVEGSGSFSMTGGTITRNRTAGSGGAIVFSEEGYGASYVKTISGGKITENAARLGGGGIMLNLVNVTVTMTGGEISGNRAYGVPSGTSSLFTACGGGIFIAGSLGGNKDVFNLEGGSIKNNYSDSGLGHGIAIDDQWDPSPVLNMKGFFDLSGNDICLRNHPSPPAGYMTIKVTGPLAEPQIIVEVNLEPWPASGTGIPILSGPYFTSYYAGWFTTQAGHVINPDGKLYTP
jgi:hypothetical protein